MNLGRLVRRHAWSHPVRALLTVGAVAVAVFLFCHPVEDLGLHLEVRRRHLVAVEGQVAGNRRQPVLRGLVAPGRVGDLAGLRDEGEIACRSLVRAAVDR